MSFFKPFGRERKLFQRSETSATPLPSPVSHASQEPAVPSGTAPAVNREVTPPHAPSRGSGPTPAENFAVEAEKQRQAEVQAEWTQAVDTLGTATRLMTAVTQARKEALAETAPVIARVIRTVVEQILVGTLAVDDDALVRVITRAAEALPADAVTLRMAPADVERVRHLLPEALSAVVQADKSIVGGCVATTQRATVDASLDAATAAVDDMLAEWAESRLT